MEAARSSKTSEQKHYVTQFKHQKAIIWVTLTMEIWNIISELLFLKRQQIHTIQRLNSTVKETL
jgi:hypothetical protein